MLWWILKSYESERGEDLTRSWYDSEAPEVQAAFDVKLNLLSGLEDWFSSGHAETLNRDHAGHDLHQVKLEVACRTVRDDRQPGSILRCRAVGFIRISPSLVADIIRLPGEFVFLNSCTKGQGKPYVQAEAFDKAVLLKIEADEGKGALHDADF